MTLTIRKNYQDPHRDKKQKAYQYLASLGILAPKLDHPEDLFYMGVPADADVYDEYAAAIAQRIEENQKHLSSSKTPQLEHERNFLAILSVNAIAFSFNHKLPQETDGRLTNYLAQLWGRSKLAELLKKINALPPQYRGDLIILSEVGAFDRVEFRQKEFERSMESRKRPTAKTPEGLVKIIQESVEAANTALHLYTHLYEKADWQERKSRRTMSYDREVPSADGGGEHITFRETLVGMMPEEIYENIDQKSETARIHVFIEKLSTTMQTAVKKFYAEEPMTPTERKAKDRGIKKIRGWMKEKKG